MKQIFLFLLTFTFSTGILSADPEDCMAKVEAEKLMQKILKERYLVDFCDCCYDVNDGNVTANLILVKNATIEVCAYDAERFSVRMEAVMVASLKIRNQKYVEKAPFSGNDWNLALLNYQFYWENGKARHLGYAVRNDYEAPSCSGIQGFPDPKLINDKKYTAWLKKKK